MADTHPTTGLDLHLDVTRGPGVGRALAEALRDAVRTGRLSPGTRLPGTRSLAADLGIARGTAVEAYSSLIAEGWLTGTTGAGTWVAEPPAPLPPTGGAAPEPGGPAASAGSAPPADRTPARGAVDLRPGRPDLSSFPRTLWASAVRRALAAAPDHAWDYGDPTGQPRLRAALAAYTARTRGVRADPDAIVVTSGFSHALAVLGRALHSTGIRHAATEDPGLARHRDLLRAAGLHVAPVPVDDAGADPDHLADHVGAVLLTPAHQHPRGVVLAPRRRAAFLDRARRRGVFLVEDDYDGEFRYDRQPVGAMQAHAPERVVYAGSASKALAPGMRLGWLAVPPALRDPVRNAVAELGAEPPAVDQLAFADLLERGDYDRHIRQARLAYRRRRTDLAARLPRPLAGVPAGLHALVPVASPEAERRTVEAARYAGLTLHGLHTAGYWHTPSPAHPAALVIGYATPPPHTWRAALDALPDLLTATR
ncbi:PLP-dependent aminotransferase family protein [Yinghuangia sp. YIM S09857]|uniref:MocR-like pyridoxine biosynthesis transcription factor PdxR n=1 Tax=Yinghuangia sp. YIM S09857 TaxID=3436929 RepID=UPI003F52FFA4